MSTLDLCTLLAVVASLLGLMMGDSKRREFASVVAILLTLSPVLAKTTGVISVVLLSLLLILVFIGLEVEHERLRAFKFPLQSRLPIILMGMVLTVGVTVAVYWTEKASFSQLKFDGDLEHWWRFLFAVALILHIVLMMTKKRHKKERKR